MRSPPPKPPKPPLLFFAQLLKIGKNGLTKIRAKFGRAGDERDSSSNFYVTFDIFENMRGQGDDKQDEIEFFEMWVVGLLLARHR